jgi:sulfide:quinone oxidoreductase
MPFDLFLAVPVHRAPAVVLESGMAPDGWIPVNPLTLETSYEGVYAVGDVAAVGTPRAGVFAEGQAAVAAQHIAATIRGDISDAEYGGRGVCYLEMGDGEIALVDVTFFGDKRVGQLVGPPPTTWPTRRSSARAGSSAGSGATGRRSERCRPRRGVRLS